MFDLESFLLPTEPIRLWDLPVPVVAKGNELHVYITTAIDEPNNYNELCFLLAQAASDDIIHIHLNTPGGQLDSAIMILESMRNSKARIIGHLSGSVNSAGTMITMGCDEIRIARHTSFMIHYYSATVEGKGNELKQRQDFMDRTLQDLMYDVYIGFLTPTEIQAAIDGTDYWLDSNEVLERWDSRLNPANTKAARKPTKKATTKPKTKKV